MKKSFALLASALLFFSCSDALEEQTTLPVMPETPSVQPILVPLSASANQVVTESDLAQTRASLANKTSRWEVGDKVALYAQSYTSDPQIQPAELIAEEVSDDGKTALLKGLGSEPAEKDTYFAVHPFNCPIDATRAQFTIDATQIATNTPQLLLAAQCTDQNIATIQLDFRPANAFLLVRFAENTGITSVRFEGCDNEFVAGVCEYKFADGTTSLTGTSKSITIDNPGTEIYFTLPAMTLNKGYKLTFFKGSEQMVKSYDYGQSKEFQLGYTYAVPEVKEFVPFSATLGEVKTSYENPEARMAVSTISVTKSSFAGIPNKLVSEAGISVTDHNGITTEYPGALSTSSKEFSLDIPQLASGLYTVKTYIKGLDGSYVMHSSPKTVGVVDGAVSVELTTANTSLNAGAAREATPSHGEIAITGSYAHIADVLIAERGLLVDGQRRPAVTDNSGKGTLNAARNGFASAGYEIGAYIKDTKGNYYDTPATSAKKVYVIETPQFAMAGENAAAADAVYTTYNSRNNSEDGSSIYFKGAIASLTGGIANEVLDAGGFTIEVQVDTNTPQTVVLSSAVHELNYTQVLGDQSWAAHTVTASLKHQGNVINSVTKTLHVTGLPYTAAPPTNSGALPWSNASWNVSFGGSFVKIGGVSGSGEAAITSPAFHIPSDINIAVTTNCYIAASKVIWWLNTDFTVDASSQLIKQNSNSKKQDYTLSGNGSFTPSSNKIKCKSSYAAAGPYVELKTITVSYR